MQAIYLLAMRELKSLIYSPIAWILLAALIGVAGAQLTAQMATFDAVRRYSGSEVRSVTRWLFLSLNGGVLPNIRDQLLYFVPLLSMGAFSREKSAGTLLLPLSSPVSIIQLVTGKYVALVACFIVLAAVVAAFALLVGVYAPLMDTGALTSGVLAVFLLCCSYGAIGIFISSLTKHQIVAALSTAGVIFVLGLIGRVGQSIPIVGEVAYWLSLDGRADWMLLGLITSEDVLYFVAITVLFLALTCFRLRSRRAPEHGPLSFAPQVALVVGVVAIGYLSSLPVLSFHADMTRARHQSLSEESLQLLDRVPGPMSLTAYVNVLDSDVGRYLPEKRRITERIVFDRYRRAHTEIDFRYVFYYASVDGPAGVSGEADGSAEQRAQRWAYQYGIPFERILSWEALEQRETLESNGFRPLFTIDAGGRMEVLRMLSDRRHFPGELNISSAVKRMLEGKKTIGFASSNGERSAFLEGGDHYRDIFGNRGGRGSLVNLGFDIVTVDPQQELPVDLDVLIIAAPTRAYSEEATDKLRADLQDGGDAMILVEPGTAGVVQPFLDYLGISAGNQAMEQTETGFDSTTIFAGLMPEATTIIGAPGESEGSVSEVTLALSGAASLAPLRGHAETGFRLTPIVATTGEQPSTFAYTLERDKGKRTQRVVVVGDADFISETTVSSEEFRAANAPLFTALLRWVVDNTYPMQLSRMRPIDVDIAVNSSEIRWMRRALVIVVPMFVLMVGAFFLFVRRRA